MRRYTIPLLLTLFMIPLAGAERLIRVNGDALVESEPDFAVVRLNLEAKDRLLKRARVTHEADIASVLQAAAKYKIAAVDIARDFPEIESRGDGFLVRRTIQLTLRDLKSFDAMLFDLYDSAAVTVESVEFRVNDLRKLRDQARALAIKAAEEKVQAMAQAMKRRVGRVMDVRVEAGGGTLLRRRGQTGYDDNGRSQVSQNFALQANTPGGGAELFRVPVTAKVDVEYEILE
jgi:uncharacterized protein YggE